VWYTLSMVSERDNVTPAIAPCSMDDVIELYARDVDCSLLRANLRRTVDQRLAQAEEMFALRAELQNAVRRAEAKANADT